MYRLIVILILAGIIYWLVKRALFPVRGRTSIQEEVGEELVRDPVCGCYLPKNHSVAASHGGKPVFFCSRECLEKFQASNRLPKN